MRHRVKSNHLNRDTNNRKALFKSLITNLIQVGEIKTTEAKAKAIKGLTDKLIHRAQNGSVAARRVLARFFGRRDIVNMLVDEVAPAMSDRSSGFTRITKIGKRRGDNADLVKMELVTKPAPRKEGEKVEEVAVATPVEKTEKKKAVK